jgi:hypothetical protein
MLIEPFRGDSRSADARIEGKHQDKQHKSGKPGGKKYWGEKGVV